MSDIASVADEPLTRAQIHMGEPEGEPLLERGRFGGRIHSRREHPERRIPDPA